MRRDRFGREPYLRIPGDRSGAGNKLGAARPARSRMHGQQWFGRRARRSALPDAYQASALPQCAAAVRSRHRNEKTRGGCLRAGEPNSSRWCQYAGVLPDVSNLVVRARVIAISVCLRSRKRRTERA